jgi:hypothetical protein
MLVLAIYNLWILFVAMLSFVQRNQRNKDLVLYPQKHVFLSADKHRSTRIFLLHLFS